MKKLLPFLLFTLFTISANAQRKDLMEIRYVLKGSSDTLVAKAYILISLFNKKYFNPLSFDRFILTESTSGRKKIKEKDVQWLYFIDFENNERVFKDVPELEIKDDLLEVKTSGRITWYIQYVKDLYDGSPVARNYFIKNGESPIFCGFINLCKKKIGSMLEDKKDIAEEWKQTRPKNEKSLLKIIEKYNSSF